MYRLVESLDDVIVQRLRSGSVIAEMLVTLDHQKGTSFLDCSRNIPPSFNSSEPDWKAITLQFTCRCHPIIWLIHFLHFSFNMSCFQQLSQSLWTVHNNLVFRCHRPMSICTLHELLTDGEILNSLVNQIWFNKCNYQ